MEDQDPAGLLWQDCCCWLLTIDARCETGLFDERPLTEDGSGFPSLWNGDRQGGQHLHGVGLAIKNSLLPGLSEAPEAGMKRLMTLLVLG